MPTVEQARTWYIQADPIHDFAHVLRVYRMAEKLAMAEGADGEIVRAAALLHDAQGATPSSAPGGSAEERANHHQSSAEFAAQVLASEGWTLDRIAAVQHCIRAHRYRSSGEAPITIEAKVLFDADKLDVLGAIGAARTIGYSVLDGQPFFSEPSEQFLSSGIKEDGEPHSSYHEFLFKLRKVKDRLFTPTAQALAEKRHQYLVDFYQQLQEEIAGRR